MSKYEIKGNHVELTQIPKKFKKLTATRFGTVLGLNRWNTPFSAWCEMTKVYEDPFEDSIYTVAGKAVESKIRDYLRKVYFMDIKSPEDVYGKDYFKKTWGDFFPEVEAFGGMWDFIGDDLIVEVKSTKRAEDWADDVPIYYELQAVLYAYLKDFDNYVIPVAFLDEETYAQAQYVLDNFSAEERAKMYATGEIHKYITWEPDVSNTKIYERKVSEEFPNFEEEYVIPALEFWKNQVLTGISPDFDEKKDADILKVLRKNIVEPEEDEIKALIAEADKIQASIDLAEAKLEDKRKRLKEIDAKVKKYMGGQFRDGDKKVEITGSKYVWTVTKSIRPSVDSDKLKADGLYEKYTKKSETLSLKKSIIEEV